MTSTTENSNRYWLFRNQLKVYRYLQRFDRLDRDFVEELLYTYPDEGKKLIQNYNMSNNEKLLKLALFLINSPQITLLIFGDQRMGKDGTITFIIEYCLELLNWYFLRIVTLGNIKKPPWVNKDDMYFSFTNIPHAKGHDEVWVYCSEIETVYPSREGASQESRAFTQQEGTMAQNHQKLFGAVKLASKVDLNVIRGCNVKMFKYISPDKLQVEGTERSGIISPLGELLIPKDRNDKSEVLVSFDNNLLTIKTPLVKWWTQDYSEMYSDISMDMIWEYVETMYTNDMKPEQIVTAVKQKFRKSISKQEIMEYLHSELDD